MKIENMKFSFSFSLVIVFNKKPDSFYESVSCADSLIVNDEKVIHTNH